METWYLSNPKIYFKIAQGSDPWKTLVKVGLNFSKDAFDLLKIEDFVEEIPANLVHLTVVVNIYYRWLRLVVFGLFTKGYQKEYSLYIMPPHHELGDDLNLWPSYRVDTFTAASAFTFLSWHDDTLNIIWRLQVLKRVLKLCIFCPI